MTLTHSFFARDFPGGFLNFLLILSPVRTANTHPTSPCNRSRHSGQRITCRSTRCWSRLEMSCMTYRSNSSSDRCFMDPMITRLVRRRPWIRTGGREGSGSKRRSIPAPVVVAGMVKARRGLEWRHIDCTANCCGARCECWSSGAAEQGVPSSEDCPTSTKRCAHRDTLMACA